MLTSDGSIRNHALEPEMINPFSEKQVREGVISYGLSSYMAIACAWRMSSKSSRA
jgi:hypothetical protein